MQMTHAEIDFTQGRVRLAANFAAVLGFGAAVAELALADALPRALEHVVSDDRPRVAGALARLVHGGGPQELAFRAIGDDGVERAIESTWFVQRDARGAPRTAFATAIDISAPRDAEQTLRESEARYRSALIAGRMGSWETDLATATRTWSPEGMALFGLALPGGRGQVGGADDEYLAALHPEDRHLAARFHVLADRQDSFPAEYRIVRRDGTVLHLAGRGLVIARDVAGRARRLVSIMADVTEQRQAESVLRIERERLELALLAGQMGAWDYDMATDVLWWSRQTCAIFGVDPDRFVPTRDNVIGLLHPDDRDAFVQRRRESIARREPLVLELRVPRADGGITWVGHRGQAVYDAAGKAVRTFGIVTDISERKRAEDALRDADRQKDAFIATLAHELRNPLAPIRNAVNVLRQKETADAQSAWCGDVIDRQVTQMTHLIDDLLDVSRMARGQLQLRRRPLALATAIEHAVEIARPTIDAAGHTLTLTLPAASLEVDGDLTRLAQVFSNLLINAAKYTPAGGRIQLAVASGDGSATVTVSDNGIGISAAQMPQLFEMFGQVQAALDRAQGGLGIGLSLVRRLVEMHGGSVVARSDGIGQGSAFVVTLPATLALPDEHAAPGDATGPARDGARSVLIVDDLRDSADSLAALLAAIGHDTHVAYDGEQALRLAEALQPQVVLLDLGMPAMNGYEVCCRIRAAPWGRAMTLIAQTGWGQDEDRQRTRAAGFDHHFVKPVDADALDALLRAPAAPPR